MAKGKVTKGKNLKLRKQIRRTFGALFMASAIAVAAIPVQDVEAGPGVGEIADGRASITYAAPGSPTNLTTEVDLNPSGKTQYESYIIRQLSDGSWSMNWQFKYYIISASDGTDRAIISKYNSIYPETTVALSNTANSSYYEVTSAAYNAFYAATASANYIISDSVTEEAIATVAPFATIEPTSTPSTTFTETATASPTADPITEPTMEPTQEPTLEPTTEPTAGSITEPTPTATPDTQVDLLNNVTGAAINSGILRWSKPVLNYHNNIRKMSSGGTITSGTTAGNRDYVFAYDQTIIPSGNGADYYVDYKNSGQRTSVMEWYDNYRPDVLQNFITLCEAYDNYLTALNQYNSDKDAYDAASDKTGLTVPVAPTVVTKPTYIKVNPSTDFSESEKLAYYCDFDTELLKYGSGYALVAVNDNRVSSSTVPTSSTVYLAQGGTPIGTAYNDPNGFLVITKSKEVIGIANEAFQGITNVDYLTIPSEIAYIGNDAFNGSFLKSIDIKNATNIGHRAFKGCTQLTTVTLAGTKKLGVECFENSGITSITFPYSMTEIGYGAFANCKNLASVDFSSVNNSCVLDDYSFYNCYRLNSVNMENSEIASIGAGSFAVSSNPTGSWVDVILPTHIQSEYKNETALGDLMFAGRTNLNSVTYPSDFGTSTAATIPSGTFRNCVNLSSLNFHPGKGSTLCGLVSYPQDLFLDVTNQALIISGPEKTIAGATALPRSSTWNASAIGLDNIPYVYIDSNGVECYEVSDGTYLLQANANGELTSCTLVDATDKTTPIDLVIPQKVGDYLITSIATGCFDDETLRNRIRSIEIKDDSITSLADNVFEGLPNLEKVTIGNSVQSIGSNAFADCPKLTDVTFHTPSIGYTGFTIGTDAFKTGSNSLVMHGDIVPGYAPFDFATGAESGKIDDNGKRICYKSLSPDLLTVMYDNASKEVTLLDYPKYNMLDTEHADYDDTMEEYYYTKYGSSQNTYDTYRDEFAAEWIKACDASDPITAQKTVYNSVYYGPWIDDAYVGTSGGFAKYLTDHSLNGYTVPLAFYTHQPYSITENYERGSTARGEFEAVTDSELQWIQSCLNIVVPAGVTSIDSKGFFEATENTRNVSTYFNQTDNPSGYASLQMSTDKSDPDTVPGLFSGQYKDYSGTSEYEKFIKGNDRILSVVMNDVKALPDNAFDSCERLESMIMGDDLAQIGKAPFRGCPAMTTITGNDHFTADNGILYSVNSDGSLTIEECLSARGNGIGQSYMNSTTDPSLFDVSAIREGAFEDCDGISKVYLTDTTIKVIPKNSFKDCDILTTVDLPDTTTRIEEDAFADDLSLTVTIPANEVNIATDAFEHDPRVTIATYEDSAALDYAQYYGLSYEILDARYKVEFVDYDGTELAAVQYIESGKSATPPADPTRTGYTFTGWSVDYNNVQKNLLVIAQYKSNTSDDMRHTVTFYNYDDTVVSVQKVVDGESAVAPLAPTRSGYTFTGWKPTTYTNVTKDLDIYAQFINGTSPTAAPNPSSSANPSANPSSSPSASSSPTPTATPASATKYTVTVSGGSGSGSYSAGTVVSINAYATSGNNVFDKWTTATAGVGFVDATNPTTTFTMPAANVSITATYKANTGTASTAAAASGATTGNAGTNTTTGTGTANNGGSSVQVDTNGISNPGLASANVNGSTDNFIVKITDDAAAAEAAKAALQERYGDISNIQYLPMDISLYDSTGRTKIADTSGISVDITIPLPDNMVQYAGNNRMASVLGGSIEDLNTNFTTINDVPCVSFTATHFSPYMVYVDTSNLTQGTIDSTPKTGDMIHPKWFLAIGLACVSLILFFKRDKKLVVAKVNV